MPARRIEGFSTPLTAAIAKYMRDQEDQGRTLAYGVVLERLVARDPSLPARHIAFCDYFSGAVDLKAEDLSLEDRRLMVEELRAQKDPRAERFVSPAAGWGPVVRLR